MAFGPIVCDGVEPLFGSPNTNLWTISWCKGVGTRRKAPGYILTKVLPCLPACIFLTLVLTSDHTSKFSILHPNLWTSEHLSLRLAEGLGAVVGRPNGAAWNVKKRPRFPIPCNFSGVLVAKRCGLADGTRKWLDPFYLGCGPVVLDVVPLGVWVAWGFG